MINSVVISGYLSKYHQVRSTQTGKKMATFSIYQKKKDAVQYIPVLAFDKTADFFEAYVKDGAYLECEGILSVSSRADASGKKINELNFIANRISIGGSTRMQQAQPAPQAEARKPAPANERFSNDMFSRADEFGGADLGINPDDLPF